MSQWKVLVHRLWPKWLYIQICGKIFSSKAPAEDFEEWMEQGDCTQCDIQAAVELNLSKRGTKRFKQIAQDIDSWGQLLFNHPLDPTKDLRKRIFLKSGSICWLPSHTNARHHSFHRDRHGRWIAIWLSSAHTELVIIFAYHVCDSVITGETTSKAAREKTSLLLTNNANALDIRKAFLHDLGLFLETKSSYW